MNQIIVSVNKFRTKIGIIENEKIINIHIERKDEVEILGNIYKGKIEKILPGMESTFIDIGLNKNAYLSVNKINEKNIKIENVLKNKEEIIVQIINEPGGNKGVRVTNKFTIPGFFLVLLPNADYITVSQKITCEKEKERLEKILKEILPIGMGAIVRTAGAGKDRIHFKNEVDFLLKKWEEITKKFKMSKVGDILYKEKALLYKIINDAIVKRNVEIIIDDKETYLEVINYITTFNVEGSYIDVKLFQEKIDIFEEYKIQKEIEKFLLNRVELKCGGYLIIEETEALVSIDINTGKNVGKNNLYETVLKTNLHAAMEIPRQLMLRNLGGIIIIDFIGMKDEKDRILILETLEENLKKDKVKTQIETFTKFGLVEMARKRTGKPLSYYYQEKCQNCKGSGKVYNDTAIIELIFGELNTVLYEKDINLIKIFTTSSIKSKLEKIYFEFIKTLIYKVNKKIEIIETDEKISKGYKIILER